MMQVRRTVLETIRGFKALQEVMVAYPKGDLFQTRGWAKNKVKKYLLGESEVCPLD
jgi:hypothetical protein